MVRSEYVDEQVVRVGGEAENGALTRRMRKHLSAPLVAAPAKQRHHQGFDRLRRFYRLPLIRRGAAPPLHLRAQYSAPVPRSHLTHRPDPCLAASLVPWRKHTVDRAWSPCPAADADFFQYLIACVVTSVVHHWSPWAPPWICRCTAPLARSFQKRPHPTWSRHQPGFLAGER